MNRLTIAAASAALSLCLAGASHATEIYDNLYIFGDSLSDTGNLQVFSQDPTMPPRFTNGPVAVEVLAAQLGLSISNSLHLTGAQYGNNYAVAGAIAIDEDGNEATPDINLPTQVNSFLAFNNFQAPQDALYVLMIGGNDIRAARTIMASATDGARKQARLRIKQATQSIKAQLQKLISAGAHNILVVNAPDVGAIPETDLVALQVLSTAETKREKRIGNKLEKITSILATKYNNRLSNVVRKLEHKNNIDMIEVDLFQLLTDSIDNADKYGLTNTEDACIYVFSQAGAFNPECNLDTFVFFDEIHPTATLHQRAGITLYNAVSAHTD